VEEEVSLPLVTEHVRRNYAVVSPKNYTPGLSIRSVSVPPAPYDGS
jgi:hypothetical protein